MILGRSRCPVIDLAGHGKYWRSWGFCQMPLKGGEAYPVQTWLSSWNRAIHTYNMWLTVDSSLSVQKAPKAVTPGAHGPAVPPQIIRNIVWKAAGRSHTAGVRGKTVHLANTARHKEISRSYTHASYRE